LVSSEGTSKKDTISYEVPVPYGCALVTNEGYRVGSYGVMKFTVQG